MSDGAAGQGWRGSSRRPPHDPKRERWADQQHTHTLNHIKVNSPDHQSTRSRYTIEI